MATQEGSSENPLRAQDSEQSVDNIVPSALPVQQEGVPTSKYLDQKLQQEETASSSSKKELSEEEATERFTSAKKLFKDGKYLEASDLLCDVLEFRYLRRVMASCKFITRVAKYGDLAIECADAYYLYGRSLFLGAAGSLQEKLAEGDSDDEEEEDDVTEEKKEAEETIEVAWEVLEAARVAYEKSGNHLLELSDVYNALYELSSEIGQDGIAEAQKCVDLRKQALSPHSRDLSVAFLSSSTMLTITRYYTLALAQYAADRRREAHDNFKKALETLNGFITSCPADSPDLTDVKGVLEDLKKTIAEFDFSEVTPVSSSPSATTAAATTTTTTPTTTASIVQTTSTSSSSSNISKPPSVSRIGGATEATGFAAPSTTNAPENVNFLGLVGRSAKRAAASNATTSTSTSTSSASTTGTSTTQTTSLTGEKRKGEFEDAAGKKPKPNVL